MHACTYPWPVDLEWDPKQAATNLLKHGIDFADAATVLHDDHAITILDEVRGEERFISLGTDALGRLMIVVSTWRNRRIRLISARRATAHERARYEERR